MRSLLSILIAVLRASCKQLFLKKEMLQKNNIDLSLREMVPIFFTFFISFCSDRINLLWDGRARMVSGIVQNGAEVCISYSEPELPNCDPRIHHVIS